LPISRGLLTLLGDHVGWATDWPWTVRSLCKNKVLTDEHTHTAEGARPFSV
jgi:hypothetical protein